MYEQFRNLVCAYTNLVFGYRYYCMGAYNLAKACIENAQDYLARI